MEFIYEADGALSDDLCDFIIEKYEKDPNKHPGYISYKTLDKKSPITVSHIKKTTDIDTGSTSCVKKEWDYIVKLIQNICVEHTHRYLINFVNDNIDKISSDHTEFINGIGSRIVFDYISNPQIQKYEKGGYFKWHDDQVEPRILSFIIYLNTLDDGDGGETEFFCGKIIKPKRGKIVIFPATWNYFHRGKEILNGSKYIVSIFGGYKNIKSNNTYEI